MRKSLLLLVVLVIVFSLFLKVSLAEDFNGVIKIDKDLFYYQSGLLNISGGIYDEQTNDLIENVPIKVFVDGQEEYFDTTSSGSFSVLFPSDVGVFTVTGASITTSESAINVVEPDTFIVIPEIELETPLSFEYTYPLEDQKIIQGIFVNEDGNSVEVLEIGYLNEDGYGIEGNPISQASYLDDQAFGFLFDGGDFFKPGRIGIFANGALVLEGIIEVRDISVEVEPSKLDNSLYQNDQQVKFSFYVDSDYMNGFGLNADYNIRYSITNAEGIAYPTESPIINKEIKDIDNLYEVVEYINVDDWVEGAYTFTFELYDGTNIIETATTDIDVISTVKYDLTSFPYYEEIIGNIEIDLNNVIVKKYELDTNTKSIDTFTFTYKGLGLEETTVATESYDSSHDNNNEDTFIITPNQTGIINVVINVYDDNLTTGGEPVATYNEEIRVVDENEESDTKDLPAYIEIEDEVLIHKAGLNLVTLSGSAYINSNNKLADEDGTFKIWKVNETSQEAISIGGEETFNFNNGSFSIKIPTYEFGIGQYIIVPANMDYNYIAEDNPEFKIIPEIELGALSPFEYTYPVENVEFIEGIFMNSGGIADREEVVLAYQDNYGNIEEEIIHSTYSSKDEFGFLFDGNKLTKPGKIGIFVKGILALEGEIVAKDLTVSASPSTLNNSLYKKNQEVKFKIALESNYMDGLALEANYNIRYSATDSEGIAYPIELPITNKEITDIDNLYEVVEYINVDDWAEGIYTFTFELYDGTNIIEDATTDIDVISTVKYDLTSFPYSEENIGDIEIDLNNIVIKKYQLDAITKTIDTFTFTYKGLGLEETTITTESFDLSHDNNDEDTFIISPNQTGIINVVINVYDDTLTTSGEPVATYNEEIKVVSENEESEAKDLPAYIKIEDEVLIHKAGLNLVTLSGNAYVSSTDEVANEDGTFKILRIDETSSEAISIGEEDIFSFNNGRFLVIIPTYELGVGQYMIVPAITDQNYNSIDNPKFRIIPEIELEYPSSFVYTHPIENQNIIQGVFLNGGGSRDEEDMLLAYQGDDGSLKKRISHAAYSNEDEFGFLFDGSKFAEPGKIGIFINGVLVMEGEIKPQDLEAELSHEKVIYDTGKTTLTTTFELVESHDTEIVVINPDGVVTSGEVSPYENNYMNDYDTINNQLRFNFEPKDKGIYEIHINLVEDFVKYKSQFELLVTDPSIIFNTNGGTEIESITQEHNTIVTAPKNPSRRGYKFVRWEPSIPERMPAEDLALEAVWNRRASISPKTPSQQTQIGKFEDEDIIIENYENVTKVEKEEDEVKTLEINSHNESNDLKLTIKGNYQKELEDEGSIISLKSNQVTYNISASDINIERIAKKLKISTDELETLEIDIEIEELDAERTSEIMLKAKDSNYEVIFEPISFKITSRKRSESGDVTEEVVDKFDNYIERVIRIPEGINPEKVITGVVYNPDGSFEHVPTVVFEKDGVYYARINSLTNSIYSLISNEIEVESVSNHWAKAPVNTLAKRLVIKNPEQFDPKGLIARGAFAEYITKAIGIFRTDTDKIQTFSDVKVDNEVFTATAIANNYGIISGYPKGDFRPYKTISRQEAMAMISNAMNVINSVGSDLDRIEKYQDKEKVSPWAYESVKNVLAAKVFNDKSVNTIAPKDTITCAEAAIAIWNLLVQNGLITK